MTLTDEQFDAFDYPPEVSRRLVSDLRKLLKMSQPAFGELLSIHFQTVSKLENGRLGMDESLRSKLLILRDILPVPGVPDLLRYVTANQTGNDAFFLAMAIHRSIE